MATKLYRIERGIKVPAVAVNRAPSTPSTAALTIAKLQKGESFLIGDELEALKARRVVRDFAGAERGRNGKREFITRKVGKGLRIWRVK